MDIYTAQNIWKDIKYIIDLKEYETIDQVRGRYFLAHSLLNSLMESFINEAETLKPLLMLIVNTAQEVAMLRTIEEFIDKEEALTDSKNFVEQFFGHYRENLEIARIAINKE